ncbi:MAG: 50S ribosomal protein L4 [Candidatus Pacebacteria bacterium]|nr:50S ribosomal protein L4 [Candidatus Paceibacterota bacterium]
MSTKITIYNQKAENVGEVNLSEKTFSVKVNPDLLHQAVVCQRANQRTVLAHTKTKAEVRGGGRKPWKQKGTGRARAGSSRSPIWIGGGITFGPRKDRNFSQKINLKMKRKAILMALSDKLTQQFLAVLDKWEVSDFKTREIEKVVSNFEKKVFKQEDKKRSLLILSVGSDDKLKYSTRNLEGVKLMNLDNINILDLLKYRNLIITEEAVKNLETRYNK